MVAGVNGRSFRQWPVLSAIGVVCIAVVLTLTAADAQDNRIGQVKTAAGKVSLERAGSTIPVQVGTHLYQADRISTGDDGSVGMTFVDNSTMSLGPGSVLELERFSFDTTTHEGAFASSLRRGTLNVRSGNIARQQPEAMQIRTPAMILGVRGTELVVRAGE